MSASPKAIGRPSMLSRLFRALGADGSASQSEVERCDPELTARLRGLNAERNRLDALLSTEEARRESLRAQLEVADQERVDALTAARLAGAPDPQENADSFRKAAEMRREMSDSTAVAKNIQKRLDEITRQVSPLAAEYQREVERYIESIYAAAMRRYSALAPEVAEAVLDVAAIRRVMMDFRFGNTNGWSGEILLPDMQPQRGTFAPHLLDGATHEFVRDADARKPQVYEMLRAAGFIHSQR